MKTQTFSYADSLAGLQVDTFNSLSEIIDYIECFATRGESAGIIYADGKPLIEYFSSEETLIFNAIS